MLNTYQRARMMRAVMMNTYQRARMMRAVLFVAVFIAVQLVGVTAADAATHYIRAGAAGSANGNDWTNAYTNLPVKLVRGDTYYIADGIYTAHDFDDPVTGSTYIYVRKATTASHGTNTGWNSTYGEGEALFIGSGTIWTISTSYLDIDGQIGYGKSPGKFGFRLYSTDRKSVV